MIEITKEELGLLKEALTSGIKNLRRFVENNKRMGHTPLPSTLAKLKRYEQIAARIKDL
jgi:hypothetical protein